MMSATSYAKALLAAIAEAPRHEKAIIGRFKELIILRKAQALMPHIIAAIEHQQEKVVEDLTFESARPISVQTKSALAKAAGIRDVAIVRELRDDMLLGGMRLSGSGKLLDGTLARRISQLKRTMSAH